MLKSNSTYSSSWLSKGVEEFAENCERINNPGERNGFK